MKNKGSPRFKPIWILMCDCKEKERLVRHLLNPNGTTDLQSSYMPYVIRLPKKAIGASPPEVAVIDPSIDGAVELLSGIYEKNKSSKILCINGNGNHYALPEFANITYSDAKGAIEKLEKLVCQERR